MKGLPPKSDREGGREGGRGAGSVDLESAPPRRSLGRRGEPIHSESSFKCWGVVGTVCRARHFSMFAFINVIRVLTADAAYVPLLMGHINTKEWLDFLSSPIDLLTQE